MVTQRQEHLPNPHSTLAREGRRIAEYSTSLHLTFSITGARIRQLGAYAGTVNAQARWRGARVSRQPVGELQSKLQAWLSAWESDRFRALIALAPWVVDTPLATLRDPAAPR